MQQPRHAEQGVGAEDEGVEEVVIDPAVDHIDAPQSLGGAHVYEAIVDQQVAAFHQRRANFIREEHVFVKGRVIDSRCQEDDAGVGASLGGEVAQGLE